MQETDSVEVMSAEDIPRVLEHWCQLNRELPAHHFQPFGTPLEEGQRERLQHTLQQCAARDDAVILLASAGGKLGSIAVILNQHTGFSKPHSGVIFNLWIEPEYRRRGLGSELVAAASDWLRAQGATSAQVGWHPDNRAADLFWKQLGFRNYEVIAAKPL
ncbi:GNAT family N-acetyltransferase [Neptuniibacter halophilus]|uniref:GNAT family N-acetyltransferase n=1 Tax=Neptuniibacter halophilus TaxID=651666 RepID=UPI0025722A90|nr:GNAT family N-acetyltransferase [Neptuniibacter halophilus]